MDMVENLESEAKLVYMPKSISRLTTWAKRNLKNLYESWITNRMCNMIGVRDEELRTELAQF